MLIYLKIIIVSKNIFFFGFVIVVHSKTWTSRKIVQIVLCRNNELLIILWSTIWIFFDIFRYFYRKKHLVVLAGNIKPIFEKVDTLYFYITILDVRNFGTRKLMHKCHSSYRYSDRVNSYFMRRPSHANDCIPMTPGPKRLVYNLHSHSHIRHTYDIPG